MELFDDRCQRSSASKDPSRRGQPRSKARCKKRDRDDDDTKDDEHDAKDMSRHVMISHLLNKSEIRSEDSKHVKIFFDGVADPLMDNFESNTTGSVAVMVQIR